MSEPDSTARSASNEGRAELLHRIVTGLIVLGCVGYVVHQHPAVRETAAAVGGLGTLLLAVVLAICSRR